VTVRGGWRFCRRRSMPVCEVCVATTTQDKRAERAEQARERRREALLLAAAEQFAQHGYHSTSVSHVIESAGVSRGTFYLYFDGKDSLFLELMDRFVTTIMQVVEVVDPEGDNPTAAIRANVKRVVDVVFDNRELTLMVLREDFGLKPEVDTHLQRFYGFLREMVEGALVNGARCGLIRKVNEPLVAVALIGAIKEVFLHHLVIAPGRMPSRESIAQSLLDFGLRGLLLRSAD